MKKLILILFVFVSFSSFSQQKIARDLWLFNAGDTLEFLLNDKVDTVSIYSNRRVQFDSLIVAGVTVNYGSNNEIPSTNSGSNNFDYSANFTYSGDTLYTKTIRTNNIIPLANNTYTSANSTNRWATVYSLDGNFSDDLTVGDDINITGIGSIVEDVGNATFEFAGNTGYGVSFSVNKGNDILKINTDGNILPFIDNAVDLGSASLIYNLTYIDTVHVNDIESSSLNNNGSAIFNESGADKDFRIESNNDDSVFVIDGGTDHIIMQEAGEGNVGIGITPPAQKLHIVSVNTDIQIQLQRTGTNAGTGYIGSNIDDAFQIRNSSQNEIFNVLQTGNVGIGNTNPSSLLEIGSTATNGKLTFRATDSDVSTISNNTSDQMLFEGAGGGYYFDAPVEIDKNFNGSNTFSMYNTTTGASARSIIFMGQNASKNMGFAYNNDSYNLGVNFELLAATSAVFYANTVVTNGIRIIASAPNAPIVFGTDGWGAVRERARFTNAGLTMKSNILASAGTENIGSNTTPFDSLYVGDISNGTNMIGNLVKNQTSQSIWSNTTNTAAVIEVGALDNIVFGQNAGNDLTTSDNNILIGKDAGSKITTGNPNIFIGYQTGMNITSQSNTFIGNSIAVNSTTSDANTIIGYNAGNDLTTGDKNTIIGHLVADSLTTGDRNVIIGSSTVGGYSLKTGDNNVFIGNLAGSKETGSNKLYITNGIDETPLIYGDFAADSLIFNGDVNITGNLWVSGTYPSDFVFNKDYKLKPFGENLKDAYSLGYLPTFANKNRNNLGEYIGGLEEEVEKLYLYIEQLEKRLTKLENK